MTGLDAIDRAILTLLQLEGRITNFRLAERVNLSPSACLMRVRRLEAGGYIKGYQAQLALEKLTPSVEVFAEVTLANHGPADFDRFDRAVAEIAAVIESYKISGACDYLLKFVCVDVKSYNRVSDAMLDGALGIKTLQTLIILDQTKKSQGYPLQALLAETPLSAG